MVTAIAESEPTEFSHKAHCHPRSGRYVLEQALARVGREETDDEAKDGDNAENEEHAGNSIARQREAYDQRPDSRMVLVCSHAERIVVLLDDEVVADHLRQFRRDQIIYDPWHYLPVPMKKPGALRNGGLKSSASKSRSPPRWRTPRVASSSPT